ncbi:MAG: hypothetical protein KDC35_20995 [Acidobacteria bacterium]|nr:hypothetical protein [Acidobacteriota bacterium]
MTSTLIALMLWTAPADSNNVQLQSFERVWQIINEKHWDLAGTGVDWQQVHETYLPKAMKAKNRTEMRAVIRDMIHELGQTHFGILGAERYDKLDELKQGLPWGSGDPGFEVRAVEGRVFVVKSWGNVPVGTELKTINKKDLKEAVATTEKAFEDAPQRALYVNMTLNELFSGPEGDTFELSARKPGAESDELLTVAWHAPRGQIEQMGNLPPVSFEYRTEILEQNIGYVEFNVWLMPLVQHFATFMPTLKDTQGLIIDIRGNGGGVGFLANSLAGYLVQEKGKKLGTMKSLDSTVNFFIVPRLDQRYQKPVVVLIDGGSASTSEIFAAGLRDLGRAKLIGSRSAGAALPSVVETLPNGDRFQYAIADYVSLGGLKIEGTGVEPDINAPHTLASLGQGKDAAMEAAIEWIVKQGVVQ